LEPSPGVGLLPHSTAAIKKAISSQADVLRELRQSVLDLHSERMRTSVRTEMIERVLGRFDLAAQAVGKRKRAGKETACYDCADEYDVQDLLFAMLKPIIRDLEREDLTRKVSGDSGRTDLSSQEYGLIIEVKRIRDEKHADRVAAECRERVMRYGEADGLRDLFFFVYDPARLIGDRDNFVKGLHVGVVRYRDREFRVQCIVAPR
jgi:hypothetical protein